MKRLALALAAVLLALVAGCGEPVPTDKAEYVGEWHGKDMVLVITQDGNVRYRRRNGSASTSINAPISRFEGASFWVGVGIFSTKFDVSKPPYRDGNAWKMTVDGVELVRSFGGGGGDIQA
ncbi:MAG TPA: hypothetical protein VLT60_04200 [Usitatibacter sp.]|nr:hypothetical protein [Usitatibacter sp.]